MDKKAVFLIGVFALMLALFVGNVVTAQDEGATISPESPSGQLHTQAEALAKELVQAARGINLVQAIRESSRRLQLMALLDEQAMEISLASLTAINQVAETLRELTPPETNTFTPEFMTNLNSALTEINPLEVFAVPNTLFAGLAQEMAEFLRADSLEVPMLLPAVP
jgi:hypothetical protein